VIRVRERGHVVVETVAELPPCDWWDAKQRARCHRQASFNWGGKRYMCANHAASWLKRGYTMERLPGIANPYPGSWLWEQTSDPGPQVRDYRMERW
jgi:hypothetical protein